MESYKMKDGSWHLWLANFSQDKWSKLEKGDKTDICSYTRRVIRGAFLSFMLFSFASLVSAWIIFSFGNLFGWILLGYQLEFVTQLFWFMMSCVGIAAIIIYSKEKIIDKFDALHDRLTDRPEKPPGFIKLAYKKFKEKTCFRLEIE